MQDLVRKRAGIGLRGESWIAVRGCACCGNDHTCLTRSYVWGSSDAEVAEKEAREQAVLHQVIMGGVPVLGIEQAPPVLCIQQAPPVLSIEQAPPAEPSLAMVVVPEQPLPQALALEVPQAVEEMHIRLVCLAGAGCCSLAAGTASLWLVCGCPQARPRVATARAGGGVPRAGGKVQVRQIRLSV